MVNHHHILEINDQRDCSYHRNYYISCTKCTGYSKFVH